MLKFTCKEKENDKSKDKLCVDIASNCPLWLSNFSCFWITLGAELQIWHID